MSLFTLLNARWHSQEVAGQDKVSKAQTNAGKLLSKDIPSGYRVYGV
jgi:hypothetical protein